MGKKKRIKASQSSLPVEKIAPLPNKNKSPWYTFNNFSFQALLLIIIGLVCFANSFRNEYALDDEVIIVKNQYVQEGFKGIPKILSSDALESFYSQLGGEQQLSGGRYRPLSIVTFAIEQELFDPQNIDDQTQLFGKKEAHQSAKLAYVRHISNVVFYILSVLALLYFLRNFIFKDQPLIPFLTCLLFLIHPIHTEVVANVKSLDEIFSFLFIILTFIQAFRYYDTQQKKHLYFGLFFYFMALLSKEYAITLMILLPMLFCIVKKDKVSKSIVRTIPFVLVAFLYIIIRTSIVGSGSNIENPDVLNNPFIYASNIEKLATKLVILDHYLWLLFHPTILSSDYSYNTIPYTDFSDGFVWLSLIIYAGMIAATIILFRRRNILSFALAFYLLHLFLVSNLMFDLGATMGERLVYHSSFGFVLIIAIGINFLVQKINYPVVKKMIVVAGCSVLVYWCAAKDIKRNAEWKNNATLSLTDVKTVPNSVLINGNAAKGLLDSCMTANNKARQSQMLDTAIIYLKKATSIHDQFTTSMHEKFANGYLNLGYAYFLKQDFDKAKLYWDTAKAIYPLDPHLPVFYSDLGSVYANEGVSMIKTQPVLAVKLFEKAVAVQPDNIDYLNNLGMSYYYVNKDPEKARQEWERSLQIVPDNKTAMQGMELFNKK